MLENGRNPKYFVTGATGFIGNRLARRLLTEGFEVVALARSPHAARDLKSLGATIVQGDVTDRESIRHGMKGVDGVFHLAANFSFGRRQNGDMEPVNVGGTRNVLRTMRDLRIPKGAPENPGRRWRKSMGRPIETKTTRATTRRTGERSSSPIEDRRRSKTRLRAPR